MSGALTASPQCLRRRRNEPCARRANASGHDSQDPNFHGEATSKIPYSTIKEVIEANRLVLEEIRVHKADRHGVLMGEAGTEKIHSAIEEAQSVDGDAYDKAAALLISLVKGHPLESGNRRAAYAAAVDFLRSNGLPMTAAYDIDVIKGIRSGTHEPASSRLDERAWPVGARRYHRRKGVVR